MNPIEGLKAFICKLGPRRAPRSVAELDPRTLRDIGIRYSELTARGERVLHRI
ncbi:MAG TPA: hypothetical protein VEG36_14130 [Burkholderiales bacterium]|nr:hypothetical protein [Burkholderiales bacterium]